MVPLVSLYNLDLGYYLNSGKDAVANVILVEDQKAKSTLNANKDTTIARELQRKIGRPST